jgi:DNA-binding NarL/FixJ family response regulator
VYDFHCTHWVVSKLSGRLPITEVRQKTVSPDLWQQHPAREKGSRFRPKAVCFTGEEAQNMNKVILADSQAIFRAGTAKVLAMDEDLRIIAQCTDLDRMMHAITTFPGSIVVFAASLRPDMARLRTLLEASNSRGIVIAENSETASSYLQQGFRGVVFRNVTGQALVECVRRVAAGDTWAPPQLQLPDSPEEDMVGTRVRDRLTPKEMRIVALIVQGCKNREIALRLKTTEQVIKNYLRSIYDKTGVSDRLELALFTIHHRVLAQAAAEVGSKLEAEMQQAPAMPTGSPAMAQS